MSDFESRVFLLVSDILAVFDDFLISGKTSLSKNQITEVNNLLFELTSVFKNKRYIATSLDLKKIEHVVLSIGFTQKADTLNLMYHLNYLFMGKNPRGISRKNLLQHKNLLSSRRLDFKEREDLRLAEWKNQISQYIKYELNSHFKFKSNMASASDYALEKTYDFYFTENDIILFDSNREDT